MNVIPSLPTKHKRKNQQQKCCKYYYSSHSGFNLVYVHCYVKSNAYFESYDNFEDFSLTIVTSQGYRVKLV